MTVVFALFAVGCAPVCPSGLTAATSVDLYFGRGGVSDADWQDFLARAVVPRFPDGMTVFDAAGSWRDPATGRTASEASKVLRVIVPDARAASPATQAVIDDYKKRFAQQSVLRVEQGVCHAF
ncbi:MAG: DUF3574 domain-containing protein [Proteobacteria bacterium]|nr:DUF3574 domain-containing protein [Pseudomonadota bacterium]